MTFTVTAILILWVVLPFVSAPLARGIGIPGLVMGLTLTSAVLAGLSVLAKDPFFTAQTFGLLALGGIALIGMGLGQKRHSNLTWVMGALGLLVLHLATACAYLFVVAPEAMTGFMGGDAQLVTAISNAARWCQAAGGVSITCCFLFGLVSRIRPR